MTVATPDSGGAIQPYDEEYGTTGLEDVDASDLRMPRLSIEHKTGMFVNTLTKEEFPALTVVILGLIKQRIFWPDKMEDDSKPRCKSSDNVHGFPNQNENGPKRNLFPFSESNFTPDMVQPVEIEPNATYPQGWSSNGHGVLPCEACKFSKWYKDEDGKNAPPPCNEQHTYPLLYMVQSVNEDNPEQTETLWVPAILTVQRSAISNSRAFINGFAQARQPFFTSYVGLTLRMDSKGTNVFCVPEFKKMGPSDRNNWGEYANQLRSVREYLRAAPRRATGEDDAPDSESNENTAPEAVAEAPAPAAPPVAAAPPAPPAAPPAPPAAPPQAATPPAPPAAPAAPPAPPAPPAAAAPPAPPAAPQVAPEAPAADPSGGLPF